MSAAIYQKNELWLQGYSLDIQIATQSIPVCFRDIYKRAVHQLTAVPWPTYESDDIMIHVCTLYELYFLLVV